jgi:hypothetical protein
MAKRASCVRPRDSRLGSPGPGINSEGTPGAGLNTGTEAALARLLVRRRRSVDRANLAILYDSYNCGGKESRVDEYMLNLMGYFQGGKRFL